MPVERWVVEQVLDAAQDLEEMGVDGLNYEDTINEIIYALEDRLANFRDQVRRARPQPGGPSGKGRRVTIRARKNSRR